MKRYFAYLEKHYKNQAEIAEAFGISTRTYQRWRKNGIDLPKRTKQLIETKVKLLRLAA